MCIISSGSYLGRYAAEHRVAPRSGVAVRVVGCGNSGAEIALDLAENGVAVAMVVRGPVHVIPRDIFGRPSQQTGVLLSGLPLGLRDAIVFAASSGSSSATSRAGESSGPPSGPIG